MTDLAIIRQRYAQLRQVSRQINKQLMASLPTEAIQEAGRRLGMWHQGTLVFDDENEMAVLFDYAIHDVDRNGRNAVDEFLAAQPPPAGSDEELLLHAMRQGWFTMLQVKELAPGTAAYVYDILNDRPLLLADVGLSQQGRPGYVLSVRLIDVGDFCMTTGGAAPALALTPAESDKYVEQVQRRRPGRLSRQEQADFNAELIRMALRRTAGSAEPAEGLASRREPVVVGARAGRNEPCPCGSGKKYKRCCMRA